MEVLVSRIFPCCVRKNRRRGYHNGVPNEQDSLLPVIPDDPSVDESLGAADHDLHARLSHVVRAKEGRMVNVHSRLPFNLRGSASRSPSTSTSNLPPHDHLGVSSPLASASTSSLQDSMYYDESFHHDQPNPYPPFDARLVDPETENKSMPERGRKPRIGEGGPSEQTPVIDEAEETPRLPIYPVSITRDGDSRPTNIPEFKLNLENIGALSQSWESDD